MTPGHTQLAWSIEQARKPTARKRAARAAASVLLIAAVGATVSTGPFERRSRIAPIPTPWIFHRRIREVAGNLIEPNVSHGGCRVAFAVVEAKKFELDAGSFKVVDGEYRRT